MYIYVYIRFSYLLLTLKYQTVVQLYRYVTGISLTSQSPRNSIFNFLRLASK